MKFKFLIPIVLSIIIGVLIGNVFFSEYDNKSISAFYEGEKVYFVQMGVYKEMDSLKSDNPNYLDYAYVLEDDGYHLYVGVSKKENIASRIKTYYESDNKSIYIKEKNIANASFLNILTEYDKITSIATNDRDLINIEKIVLSNYKEMVLQE